MALQTRLINSKIWKTKVHNEHEMQPKSSQSKHSTGQIRNSNFRQITQINN